MMVVFRHPFFREEALRRGLRRARPPPGPA
jgi:hypothetical protein